VTCDSCALWTTTSAARRRGARTAARGAGEDLAGGHPCAQHRACCPSQFHVVEPAADLINRRESALAGCLSVAGPGEIIPTVPAISRFFGIVIAMFFDDHDPPHFHARHAAGAARVRIDTLEVMDSTLGRRHQRLVLAWAELHQEELIENWKRARAGETLNPIEPLR
jgi:hypothetical protein